MANLLAFQPDEQIAQVIEIPNYEVAPYLVLATKNGLVKKTRARPSSTPTGPAASSRSTCATTTNWSAPRWSRPSDDLLLVSQEGAGDPVQRHDEALRPMGRATSGVIGMRFTEDDELLAMEVVREGMDVLVATDGGYAKRTPIEEYPVQGRGGKGVLTAKITERRGGLVGAVVIKPGRRAVRHHLQRWRHPYSGEACTADA